MPRRKSLSRRARISGTLAKGKRGLGIDSVTGRKRTPRPAARRKALMKTLRTGFQRRVWSLENHVLRQGRVLLPAFGVEPRVGVGDGRGEVEAERVDGAANGRRVAFDLDEVADGSLVEGHGAVFERPFLPFLL